MDYSPGTFCTLVTNFYNLRFRICYYLQTPSEIGYCDRQQLPPFDKYWILAVYLLENMLLENSILSLVKKLKLIWGKRLEWPNFEPWVIIYNSVTCITTTFFINSIPSLISFLLFNQVQKLYQSLILKV